jgi:hypothetical protein
VLDKGTLVGLTPEAACAAIREMAAKGIKHTGEIVIAPGGLNPEDIAVLKAVVDEGKKAGVQIKVHAVSTPAMIGAVNAGVTRLVHMPNKDFTSHEEAKKIADTGSIVLGLLAFGAPIIDRYSGPPPQVHFPKDDSPHFRDGKPWHEAINGANRDAAGKATGTETGFTIVTDIFGIITINTARYLNMRIRWGQSSQARLPTSSCFRAIRWKTSIPMLNTKMVIKGGKVVVDKRQV